MWFSQNKNWMLGMIIDKGKISMDTGKLKGIKEWPIPTTIKQVRGFLGFGNFYWQFIKHFSEIARPLNDLLKKDKKFKWTNECQNSFKELKKWFTEEPVLQMPDQNKPFQIECDASQYALGAVLTQLDLNGNWHPCTFISKMFSPQEQWYEVGEWELLAIIWVLKEWRHYIQGSGHTTTVFSNHKNLTYFTTQKLNDQQAQWSLYIPGFDIKLIHQLGTRMIQSGALSWRPNYV